MLKHSHVNTQPLIVLILLMLKRSCNTLQDTAKDCKTLQDTATHRDVDTQPLKHIDTDPHCTCPADSETHCKHCQTLQHTTTRCNILSC